MERETGYTIIEKNHEVQTCEHESEEESEISYCIVLDFIEEAKWYL